MIISARWNLVSSKLKKVTRKFNQKTWKRRQLLSESGFVLRIAPPPLSRDKRIKMKKSIKSLLHSPYYAEVCNDWRGPSPRLNAWTTQLQTNVATVASRWRHCDNLTDPGIEAQTSRTDSVRLSTELTSRCNVAQLCSKNMLLV